MIRFYNGKVLTLKNDFEISNDEVWVKTIKFFTEEKMIT